MAEDGNPLRFGILLVHGIGEQQRGDTLLQFGEPLVRLIRRVVASPGPVDSLDATPAIRRSMVMRPEGSAIPSHFILEDPERQGLPWLVAESWWASDIRQASFGDVVKWGTKITPFVLTDTVRHQWEPAQRRTSITNLQLPLTLLLAPIIQTALLILIVLSRLPMAGGLAKTAMTRLANSLGDPYLLLSSPLRFSSMVERLHSDIRWLKSRGCEQVALVAHSQGAAIAHRALKTLPTDSGVVIERFVSFGSAIRKLQMLSEIDRDGGPRLKFGAWLNLVVILEMASLFLAWRIDLGTIGILGGIPVRGLLLVFILWFIASVLYWVFALRATTSFRNYGGEVQTWFTGEPGTPLSWQDVYARADPVSLGKLDIDSSWHYTSTEIRNRDSIILDHTAYWRNTEQFVAPVAQGLLAASGWGLANHPILQSESLAQRHGTRSDRASALIGSFRSVAVMFLIAAIICRITNLLGQVGGPVRAVAEFARTELPIPFEGWLSRNIGNGPDAQNVQGLIVLLVTCMIWFSAVIASSWERWNVSQVNLWLSEAVHSPDEGGQLFRLASRSSSAVILLVIAVTVWTW